MTFPNSFKIVGPECMESVFFILVLKGESCSERTGVKELASSSDDDVARSSTSTCRVRNNVELGSLGMVKTHNS